MTMLMQVKSFPGSTQKFSWQALQEIPESHGSAVSYARNAGLRVFGAENRHYEAKLPSLSHGPEYLYALQRLALSDRGRPA
jgi:hypothetical protein